MGRTRVGVGVVVQRVDGHVLLAERRAEGGVLALPGGRLEAGETVEECAERELREETGLELAGAETFGCVLVEGWVVVGVRGSARGEPAEREPDKVGGFRWIDPAAPPAAVYEPTAALLRLL